MPAPIRRLYVLEDPRLGLRLELEPQDHALIRLVVSRRFHINRENGNYNGATHPEKGEGQDQTGTPGEVAWWLAHGVQPTIADLVRPDYIAGEIDAFGAEVRSTEYDHGHLLIQGVKTSKKDAKKVEDGVPFILAIVAEHYVDFRGWFIPQDRLRKDWWKAEWDRPCYAVPQDVLFSLIPSFKHGVLTCPMAPERVLSRRWLPGPKFEPIHVVPDGTTLAREEADERGVVHWTRSAYMARFGHLPPEEQLALDCASQLDAML